MNNSIAVSNQNNKFITIVSIILPLAVAALFGIHIEGYDFSFLPPIYASINFTTALVLIFALIAVKSKKIELHQKLMITAMALSVVFLLLYVAYHITSETTVYGGDGILKYVYYFILFTHIILSVVVIPLVLISYVRGTNGAVEEHKKIVKFAFPLWLYVAISGVLVYLLIAPYYI